jgi:heterodisulfide reductase subunit C
VGNRSAQPVRNKPKTQSAKSNVDLSELNEFEREIEENLEEELEIEKIKAEELKKK